jgi:hypothetical protein
MISGHDTEMAALYQVDTQSPFHKSSCNSILRSIHQGLETHVSKAQHNAEPDTISYLFELVLLWNCSTWQTECQDKRKEVYAPIFKVLNIQPCLNLQVLEIVGIWAKLNQTMNTCKRRVHSFKIEGLQRIPHRLWKEKP